IDSGSIRTQLDCWETLYNRFEQAGDLNDISEAISILREVVERTPEWDVNLAKRLNNLGNSFAHRFGHTGNLSDLAEAISLQTRAVDLTPEGHDDLPSRLNNLGESYLRQFERTGNLGDVAAISLQTRAVDPTPEGHADLPSRLMNLGNSYLRQFGRTGNLGDVAESISLQTRAVGLTPKGHIALPSMLASLGGSYRCQFERTGDLEALVESISLQTHAVDLTPDGHADLPTMLTNLGASYLRRFERIGNLEDVAKSISLQTRAISLAPKGHPHIPNMLMNLGTFFLCNFERTLGGNLGDVAESISLQTRAIRLTPEGHADLPGMLMNLGRSFLCRFERTGNLKDVAESLSLKARAVRLTPEGHIHLPGMLMSLGGSFLCRFQRTQNILDVEEAISLQSRAVALTPAGHAHRPVMLSNLGACFMSRFKLIHDYSDLSRAISAQTQSVDLIPYSHVGLPMLLNNLANSLTCRFEHSGYLGDVTEAIKVQTRVVGLAPDGHASLPGCPQDRLCGATWWARLCHRRPGSLEVINAFETALHLLTLVAGLGETVQHQYAKIEEYGELPAEAAAAAIRLGAHRKALEWLEQGRCLVWGQQSRLRIPLDELRTHNEVLANRVMEVSRLLEGLGSSRQHSSTDRSLAGKAMLEDEALRHLQLASEWERLLEHVRETAGFENFLRPLRCAALVQHLPRTGPVIVLNIHELCCDAIILGAGLELHRIPLPSFTLAKANQHRRTLAVKLYHWDQSLRQVEHGRGRAAGRYRDKARDFLSVHSILKSLWDEVVKPILNVLGFPKGDSNRIHLLPRIWWCPTGLLSFLPLHAAGIYRGEGVENVSDYAVSSYTPTVTALTQRVKSDFPVDEQVSGLFLACQPEVPDLCAIHGTKEEVRDVHREATALGVRSLSLEGGAVTPEKCLEYMEEYSSIHLACHGGQDISDPLQSRFLFHNGSLTLNSIMQKNLPNADLAYLSACRTSAGEVTLANEVVHLAAGMLAAGYRRVVSTMWEIGDGHASQVARDFYQYLWKHRPEGSGSRFDGSLSAYALQHAAQELRDRLDNTDSSLLTWMPFVHYGY
ncbi:hypothetical protein FA13DRAFT_1852280, partial [Coprinellus micaceus]